MYNIIDYQLSSLGICPPYVPYKKNRKDMGSISLTNNNDIHSYYTFQ